MSVASLVRRGFVDSIPSLVLRGFSLPAGAPQVVGGIGTLRLVKDRAATAFNLAPTFIGQGITYSLTATHANGSFNTSTGVLTWNPLTAGTFGPYTLTATNSSGTADSDAFNVVVLATAPSVSLFDSGLGFRIRIGF